MDDEAPDALPAATDLATRAVRMRAKPWPFLYSVDPVGLVRNVRAAAVATPAAAASGGVTASAASPFEPVAGLAGPGSAGSGRPPVEPPRIVRGWRTQALTERGSARPAADRGDGAPR